MEALATEPRYPSLLQAGREKQGVDRFLNRALLTS